MNASRLTILMDSTMNAKEDIVFNFGMLFVHVLIICPSAQSLKNVYCACMGDLALIYINLIRFTRLRDPMRFLIIV